MSDGDKMNLPINQIICGIMIDNRLIRDIIIRNERDSMKSYKCITINKKQVRLHRVIMEAYIGRKLMPWELVHHNDGDIHNNTLSNLSITTRDKHMIGHEIGLNTRFQDKVYISREDIEKLYCIDKLPIHAVADVLNTTYGIILRRMVRYGIPRRKQGPITN